MEKWKSRGKGTKAESVLPPTRRPTTVPTCLPVEKKKDRKWSFGGLLRRISSGQNHDVSSNDEDITYIPGHMLSKRSTKRPKSRMKSKLGKIPDRTKSYEELPKPTPELSNGGKEAGTLELIRSLRSNIDNSQDSLCKCNDSVNSRSSEGSLEALAKASRINRMKARAQAKRDRLRGCTSSDEDSHRSSQSLAQLRSDDSAQNLQGSQRSDSCNRKTRAARTERYIRRMYRDDGMSGGSSDGKILEPPALPPRVIEPPPSQYSSKSMDSRLYRGRNDATGNDFPQGGSSPTVILERKPLVDKHYPPRERTRDSQVSTRAFLTGTNENETLEREKPCTLREYFRRATPPNEIYGSLRHEKVLPPEPPPRSSKSRVYTNVYNNAPFAFNPETQSSRRYLSPIDTQNVRSYNSDNELLLSDYVAPVRLRYLWLNSDQLSNPRETHVQQDHQGYYHKNGYCNSLDRARRQNYTPASRRTMDYREEQENHDPRPCFPDSAVSPPSDFGSRSTSSLPKGIQLFSRQRLNQRDDDDDNNDDDDDRGSFGPRFTNPTYQPFEKNHTIAKLRKQSPSAGSNTTCLDDEDEAERKRSSKNLEDALSELEAIYNSLRLSDEDLLERAEQRSMEEYRDKAAKCAVDNGRKSSDNSSNEKDQVRDDRSSRLSRENDTRIKDDMAYRRMNPKERPSSVNGQASLSQISYLATSPNLSSREGDFLRRSPLTRRATPDLTRDDLLFRSISHANNTLKVIEPQPPFGIPIGPVTSATESDYLHVKPTKLGQTRSLYIPQSEPDVVSDDLAFRNLRKDGSKDSPTTFNKNNANLFVQTDSNCDSSILPKCMSAFGTKKKRAVRSMSADIYGILGKEKRKQNVWYNDYIHSTQKLRASHDTNHFGLDINGNRPKSPLQRKIQVYVPRESAIVETVDKSLSTSSDPMLHEKPRDSVNIIGTESDDSSPELCDSKNDKTTVTTIQSFTEQELSEYKQLCQDLEKLIERTADNDAEKEEEKSVKAVTEDNNSQSEFDELEKLLIDDYDIAASVKAFDEIVRSTERGGDDRSSSRSTGHGGEESLGSDNLHFSPTNKTPGGFPDAGEESFTSSELGIGSSNTDSGSFTDSVYDKFNRLLNEVNDVPYVNDNDANNLGKSERPIDDNLADDNSGRSVIMKETAVNVTHDDSEVKTETIGGNSMQHELAPDESSTRPVRARKGKKRDEDERKMEKKEIDEAVVEKPAYRQGENVDDGSNDGFCAFKGTSEHAFRNICHVTNRVTAYHVVLCSLFLTLLITMIVAQ